MRIFKHPVKKLTLLTAFAGGYVLGAKAGRERYQQIVDAAQQVKDDPRVQQAASKAEDLVRETATKVADDPRIKDVVARAEQIVGDAAESAKSAAQDGDVVSAAKHAAQDAASKAEDVAAEAKAPAEEVANEATARAKGKGRGKRKADEPVSPLLADEHIESTDEVVYSSGPDIEETIDELAPDSDDERL